MSYPLQGTKPSRYCHPCGQLWPNDHRMTACPVCQAPTQLSDEDNEFATVQYALLFAAKEVDRRDRQDRFADFDRTIDETDLEREHAHLLLINEWELAAEARTIVRTFGMTTDELAAHFATIMSAPNQGGH